MRRLVAALLITLALVAAAEAPTLPPSNPPERVLVWEAPEKPVVLLMEATAYTHVAVPGVPDINGTGDGLTCLGVPVREGICAVDDTVIPLGTRLYIEGYGEAVAADRGGAIRGMRVDVFFECPQAARAWGRREVEVTFLD